MFRRQRVSSAQKDTLFIFNLKKLKEYVTQLDQGGLDSNRPKCILSKKLLEVLSSEKLKENYPDFLRIKKILTVAYLENNRIEKALDQKGVMYRYAVMQGSMNSNYQFDFEKAIQEISDNIINIPEKLDRGSLTFLKSQHLHQLIFDLFDQICKQEKEIVVLEHFIEHK